MKKIFYTKMYFLLIDTSNSKPFISINKNKKVILYYFLPNLPKKNLSSTLFPSIQNLLKNAKVSIKDLKFISIGTGPGLFTGTRVSASIAKSISFALNIPIVTFSSLKGFIPTKDGVFFSISYANSEKIYALKGEKKENEIFYLSDPFLIPISASYSFFKGASSIISSSCILNEKMLNFEEKDVDIDLLATISFKKFENKKITLHENLKLLYLQSLNTIAL